MSDGQGEEYYAFIVGVEPYTIHAAPAETVSIRPDGNSGWTYRRSRFGHSQAYERPDFDKRCIQRVAVDAPGERDEF